MSLVILGTLLCVKYWILALPQVLFQTLGILLWTRQRRFSQCNYSTCKVVGEKIKNIKITLITDSDKHSEEREPERRLWTMPAGRWELSGWGRPVVLRGGGVRAGAWRREPPGLDRAERCWAQACVGEQGRQGGRPRSSRSHTARGRGAEFGFYSLWHEKPLEGHLRRSDHCSTGPLQPILRLPREHSPVGLGAAASALRWLTDYGPVLTPQICHELSHAYYFFHIALLDQ